MCCDSEFAREKKLPERSLCGQGQKDRSVPVWWQGQLAEGWPIPVLPADSWRNLAAQSCRSHRAW